MTYEPIRLDGSHQEIFDTVVRGIAEQKAFGYSGSCHYRAKVNGKVVKCAAGVLIPDHLYHPRMEDHTVNSVFDAPMETETFVQIIESVHDNVAIKTEVSGQSFAAGFNDWVEDMRRVALSNGLNTAAIDEVAA